MLLELPSKLNELIKPNPNIPHEKGLISLILKLKGKLNIQFALKCFKVC